MWRAVAVAAALAASGCVGVVEHDLFTAEVEPGAVECWVDRDCPHVDCHDAPACVEGVCYTFAQERPTICSFGVCTEDGVCVACGSDADCEAVNTNECYALICTDEGCCHGGPRLEAGAACLQTRGGVCDDGARCQHL